MGRAPRPASDAEGLALSGDALDTPEGGRLNPMMPVNAEPQPPGPPAAVARRSALALLALAALPVGAGAAQAAEARLGLKLVRAIGRAEAMALVMAEGARVAAMDAAGLAQHCADDFRAGRTRTLSGVLVAETEAVAWLLAAGVRPQ